MIKIDEIKKYINLLKNAKNDALTQFVMNGEPGWPEIEEMRKDNLKELFRIAKAYKVRYLYVAKGEICGCEDKRGPDGWCAMWAIAKEAGFPASCGNGDQYQCQGSEIAFPENSYGGWDLKDSVKLTDEQCDKLKFGRVVSRPREGYKE